MLISFIWKNTKKSNKALLKNIEWYVVVSDTVESKVFNDVMIEFNDIACKDGFVDSWSDATRKKIASSYLTILRQSGLLNERTELLQPLRIPDEDFVYYIKLGDTWFLEACLLLPYEIERIKSYAL